MGRRVTRPDEEFKHEDALKHFKSALQTTLRAANVTRTGSHQGIVGARYALGIVGHGTEQEVKEGYGYVHDPDFAVFWDGARYYLLGDPKKTQPGSRAGMLSKVEKALFENRVPDLGAIFLRKVVVEFFHTGEGHAGNLKEVVHKREDGGKGVHGISLRTNDSKVSGRLLKEIRDEFRRRDGGG